MDLHCLLWTPYSSSSVLAGRPAPSNYRCNRLTVRPVKLIHWFWPGLKFPTSRMGAGGHEGRPRSRGERALLPARSELALSAEAAVCQHLSVSHMGLPDSPPALWRNRVPPFNWAQSPRGQASEGQVPLHGQSTVGAEVGWERQRGPSWAKAGA